MFPPLVLFSDFQKDWYSVFFKRVGQITRESIRFWTFHSWEVLMTASVYLLIRGLLRVSISSGVTLVVCVLLRMICFISGSQLVGIKWFHFCLFVNFGKSAKERTVVFTDFSHVLFSSIYLCPNLHSFLCSTNFDLLLRLNQRNILTVPDASQPEGHCLGLGCWVEKQYRLEWIRLPGQFLPHLAFQVTPRPSFQAEALLLPGMMPSNRLT